MQRTTNGSAEYYTFLGGTRLQMGKDGKGRYGKHHQQKKTTLDGTRDEDGRRKTGYTSHGLM